MKYRIIFSLCMLWFSSLHAQNQTDWSLIAQRAFAMLDVEIADSIRSRQSEGAEIRAEMNQIIAAKSLNRKFLLGSNDEYFQEGMHQQFKKDPRPMMHMERDSQMVRFEHLHIELYYSDKALFRWKDIQQRLVAWKSRLKEETWVLKYNVLSPEQKKTLQKENPRIRWAAQEIVCGIVDDLEKDPRYQPQKVTPMDLHFNRLNHDPNAETSPSMSLPIPADKFLASFPINGQYGFCPEESREGTGYIFFPKGALPSDYDTIWRKKVLKARWTGTNGGMMYSEVLREKIFDKGDITYFELPKRFFAKGMVYRLELVLIPVDAFVNPANSENCWQKFRGNLFQNFGISGRVPGETLITELFFRTSKYTVLGKSATMKGAIDWKAGGIITFSTDEPFDPTETQASPHTVAPVTFGFEDIGTFSSFTLQELLKNPMVYYYLSVPAMEDLTQLAPGELAVIERDNTLDAPFMRAVGHSAPELYIQSPDTQNGPKTIANGYVAPAYGGSGAQSTLTTDKPVPFISRVHFDAKKPLDDVFHCVLKIGELMQLIEAYSMLQDQIKKRIEERAVFFHALELRRAQRTGEAAKGDLEFFRQKEKENLPSPVKMVLDLDLPSRLMPGLTIMTIKRFPGTDRNTAELSLKL